MRRHLLLAALLLTLTACGASDEQPLSYPRLSYDYLTKLRLNVGSVDIDDSLQRGTDPRDLSRLAPTSPVDALRQMAQDRLAALGANGRAVFVIDEASIFQVRSQLEGRMTVHLDVSSADGTRGGYAEARVSRSRSYDRTGPNATRNALSDLVTQMMSDMNVEFEFQVRRSLRAYLQTTEPTVPAPPPIQTEDLGPPQT